MENQTHTGAALPSHDLFAFAGVTNLAYIVIFLRNGGERLRAIWLTMRTLNIELREAKEWVDSVKLVQGPLPELLPEWPPVEREAPAMVASHWPPTVEATSYREINSMPHNQNVECYQPESWSMLKDTIYAARAALEAGLENTQELLMEHDTRLGRTTRGNLYTAERLEGEIRDMKAVIEKLRQPDGCTYRDKSPMAPDGVRRQVDMSPDTTEQPTRLKRAVEKIDQENSPPSAPQDAPHQAIITLSNPARHIEEIRIECDAKEQEWLKAKMKRLTAEGWKVAHFGSHKIGPMQHSPRMVLIAERTTQD